MATKTIKIESLPSIPSIADDDLLVVRDTSETNPTKEVARVTVSDLRAAIGGGDKIEDAAGTTRVETADEAGRITATADGHQLSSDGAAGGWYETEVDPATGTRLRIERGANLMGSGFSGYTVQLLSGDDAPATLGLAAVPDGVGGVSVYQVTLGTYVGGLLTDMGITTSESGVAMSNKVTSDTGDVSETGVVSSDGVMRAFLQTHDAGAEVTNRLEVDAGGVHATAGDVGVALLTPSSAPLPGGDDSITDWIERVESEAGGTPTKIESGTSNVGVISGGDIEVVRAGTRLAFFTNGQLSLGGPSGSRLTLYEAGNSHAVLTSGGYQSAFTSSGFTQLPVGIASYMAGVHAAKSAADGLAALMPAPWSPSWSGAINVDSASHVEASVQEIGDYIDLEGSLTVTPDAAGIAVVTAALGALANPDVDKDGQASAGVSGVSVSAAGCRAFAAGSVAVVFDAASDDEHTVSFRVRYRKES